MTALRVVGLDLSITATGIAYRDGSTGTISGPSEHGDRRLLTIEQAVTIALGGPDIGLGPLPDLVVLEDLPTHARAAGITGMVHGVVRALLLRRGVPYVTLTPATLKAYATGKGTADKTAMALAAYKRSGGSEFTDDNQCDAAWLRWAGLDWLGAPEVTVPAAQRDRLNKANWPTVKGNS
ncbi:Holliday junction endonuclease [Streptomyces sp. NPDC088124]|uniref:Holliday junction endonuclease n=1 Tax=Streptomyces sp. NPDC088124 TaxID=3154654 RepID=UPI00343E60BF